MLIPINLTDVEESKPVAGGKYSLTIASAEETVTKEKKKPQLKVSIGIDGHDGAPNVSHYIGLPSEGDDPQAANFKSLLLARFLTLFDIAYSADGFDLDDFPGATASAELTLSEPDDSGNVYNRLMVPRLKSEPSAAGRTAPRPPQAVKR